MIKYHSQGCILVNTTQKEWVNTTHKDDKISLTGVYTGKYHSEEWVNTTHTDDKISFTGVYTGKYHSEVWVNTTHKDDKISFTGGVYW
jgi:hypothetical protein